MDPSNVQDQLVVIGGLAIANLGAIMGAWISLHVKIAKLEVRTELNTKDIDGIASYVETPKSKGRKSA